MDLIPKVVDVWTGSVFGSGFLLTNRLVLTAGHVVQRSTEVTARTVASGNCLPCRVVWTGRDTDTALLEILGDLPSDLLDVGRTGLGWPVGTARPLACHAIGFPWCQQRPDGRRDTEHLQGEIHLGTAVLDGRYQVSVNGGLPRRAGDSSAWAGMSGAALVADNLVVGVITEDTQHFSGGRLTAVPVADMVKDDGFAVVWRAKTGGDPQLEPVELAPLTVQEPTGRPPGSPASLLRADGEVVRFRSRTREITQLLAWAEGSGAGTHLLVGAAGQGKSRLARELVTRLRDQGWATVWLRESVDDAHYDRVVDCGEKLLIVVDYAETRTQQLRRLLLKVCRHQGKALHILLIARSAGEWWDRLQAGLAHDAPAFIGNVGVTKLAPLEDSTAGREAMFREAIEDLSEALADDTIDLNALRVPKNLNDRLFDSVLAIHLAGLITLLQAGSSALHLAPGLPAEEVLLAHERRYWQNAALSSGVDLDAEICDVVVAMAALCGAQDRDEGLGLLSAVPGLADQPHDRRLRALKWLRDLYPPETQHGWGSFQPDRIAEYFIAAVLRDQPRLIPTVMPAASEHQVRRAITVLARAACHRPDSAHHIASLLTALPHRAPIAVEIAPQAEDPAPIVGALMYLVKDSGCSVDALIGLGEAIPGRTQIMAELAAEVWATVAAGYDLAVDASGGQLLDRARALNDLSDRLGALGRHDDAVEMAEAALEAIREYLAKGPGDPAEECASILHNLAAHLSDAGRHAEALPVHQASVLAWWELVSESADRHLPDLAMSLHSLSMCLARQDRGEEALQVERQAVEVYQALAEDSQGTYSANLAMSLNSLSWRLSDEGLTEEAMSASREAVAAYRLLADQDPDGELPQLVGALNTYAAHLAKSGDYEDAVTTTEEAVGIYQQLSERNPGAFAPKLASALMNLSSHLASAGRLDEGLSVIEDVVSAYDRLPDRVRRERLPEIAMALGNLSNRLAESGHAEEALSASYRSVATWIRLAETDPDAHLASLAQGRVNLASRCGALHRLAEGIYAAEAAVADLQVLAGQHRARYEPDLASALIVLGYLRIKSGDIPVAARLLTEAFQISVARDLDRPFGKAISGLRAAYRTEPDEVAATWTAITGLPISALIQPGN